jgi:hypothetical protein
MPEELCDPAGHFRGIQIAEPHPLKQVLIHETGTRGRAVDQHYAASVLWKVNAVDPGHENEGSPRGAPERLQFLGKPLLGRRRADLSPVVSRVVAWNRDEKFVLLEDFGRKRVGGDWPLESAGEQDQAFAIAGVVFRRDLDDGLATEAADEVGLKFEGRRQVDSPNAVPEEVEGARRDEGRGDFDCD